MRLRPERYWPVSECGARRMSSGVPCATQRNDPIFSFSISLRPSTVSFMPCRFAMSWPVAVNMAAMLALRPVITRATRDASSGRGLVEALDELQGRPLRTGIGDGALRGVAVVALLGACALGVYGVLFHAGPNWPLAVAIPVGAVLVVGYNLELFGGRLHNDHAFAWGWGGFPVAVGYVAQSPGLRWSSLAAALAATLAGVGTSYAQRRLSTPARDLRRRTTDVTGSVTHDDGRVDALDRAVLLSPLEGALRALSWSVPVVAAAALLARR